MYALNLAEDGRILSVTYPEYATKEMPVVSALPEGDTSDYRYVDGKYIYDPLPKPAPQPAPSQSIDKRVEDLEAENRELKAMVQAMAAAGV